MGWHVPAIGKLTLYPVTLLNERIFSESAKSSWYPEYSSRVRFMRLATNTPLFSTLVPVGGEPLKTPKVVDGEDTAVIGALNVQDPENKATEIHNDILIKLREQLRKFMT